MSLSIPMTSSPRSVNSLAFSAPTSPPAPVTTAIAIFPYLRITLPTGAVIKKLQQERLDVSPHVPTTAIHTHPKCRVIIGYRDWRTCQQPASRMDQAGL